jgi:hypothetical protein
MRTASALGIQNRTGYGAHSIPFGVRSQTTDSAGRPQRPALFFWRFAVRFAGLDAGAGAALVGANQTGYRHRRVPVGAFSVSLDNLWPAASLKARRPNFFRSWRRARPRTLASMWATATTKPRRHPSCRLSSQACGKPAAQCQLDPWVGSRIGRPKRTRLELAAYSTSIPRTKSTRCATPTFGKIESS